MVTAQNKRLLCSFGGLLFGAALGTANIMYSPSSVVNQKPAPAEIRTLSDIIERERSTFQAFYEHPISPDAERAYQESAVAFVDAWKVPGAKERYDAYTHESAVQGVRTLGTSVGLLLIGFGAGMIAGTLWVNRSQPVELRTGSSYSKY